MFFIARFFETFFDGRGIRYRQKYSGGRFMAARGNIKNLIFSSLNERWVGNAYIVETSTKAPRANWKDPKTVWLDVYQNTFPPDLWDNIAMGSKKGPWISLGFEHEIGKLLLLIDQGLGNNEAFLNKVKKLAKESNVDENNVWDRLNQDNVVHVQSITENKCYPINSCPVCSSGRLKVETNSKSGCIFTVRWACLDCNYECKLCTNNMVSASKLWDKEYNEEHKKYC